MTESKTFEMSKLEKKTWCLRLVELFDEVLHEYEVVVDASFLNESTLACEDNVVNNRGMSVSHELGENL